MTMKHIWNTKRPLIVTLLILLAMIWLGWAFMGQQTFVQTALSGLTLGSLYFMVASGLTLIFGLMGVLNFAHGAMFMIGAYAGWQFYTNPTFIFGLLPLVGAVFVGIAAAGLIKPALSKRLYDGLGEEHIASRARLVKTVTIAGAVVLLIAALWKFDFLGLAETAMVAITVSSNPLAEATPQEPLARFSVRLLLLACTGALGSLATLNRGISERAEGGKKRWTLPLAMAVVLLLTIITAVFREQASIGVLTMNANVRFLFALVAGTVVGGSLGALVEMTLIRPLYDSHLYQLMVTMGLAFVLLELTQVLWDPLAYQMSRPPLFAGEGKAESILAWFSEHTITVDIMGVTFPSYRLFIIVLGVVMLIILSLVMRYSRLGIIIRAGVQDSEMVESLGINVRKIFTFVFVLGAGLAALGGIGSAPFIPVEPAMGDTFQLQGFIAVVIGGMGSISGAAIGALLLGLARSFGDFLALQFDLSPAISEASTVIIMAIVLLVRPAGIFGRRD